MRWTYEFVQMGGYDCMTDAFYIKDRGKTIAVIDQAEFGQNGGSPMGPMAEATKYAEILVNALNNSGNAEIEK